MCVTEGSDDSEGIWVFLIIGAGVVLIAIVVVAGVLLQRTAKYRKQAKQFDDTSR